MPYKIVQTVEGKKIKLMTCPSGWEKNNILKYPKKGLFRYIHDENSKPEPDWDLMMCIVKRSNISSYDEGEKIITDMTNRSDTDDGDDYNYPQKRYENQAALNLNIVADKIVKPKRSQNKPSTINLNDVAEIVNENVLYFENSQENLTNATITSATVLPQNVYVPYETNNPALQETFSIDIDSISVSQKQMLEYQIQILDNQKQMLENQKKLIESNTAILGQTQTVIKVQNNVLQKLSSFSVQLEDAVFQITEMRSTDKKVQHLKDSKGSIDNSPFYIKAIDSPKELDALETQLSDNNYRNNLKHTYSIICCKGGKGMDCAYALVDIMFTRKFICQCSWSGGTRGEELKVPLKGYKHVLSFFWEMINFWDRTFTLKDNENFFKTILKNAHKRKLAKCERASTSRKRSKPCPTNRKKTSTSKKEINDDRRTSQERSTKTDKNETHTGEDESQNAEAKNENEVNNANQINNENQIHNENQINNENLINNENEKHCKADKPETENAEKEINQKDNTNNEEIIEEQDEEDVPKNGTED